MKLQQWISSLKFWNTQSPVETKPDNTVILQKEEFVKILHNLDALLEYERIESIENLDNITGLLKAAVVGAGGTLLIPNDFLEIVNSTENNLNIHFDDDKVTLTLE